MAAFLLEIFMSKFTRHNALVAGVILASLLTVGGCAELQNVEAFITSPQNQATVAILSKASVALVCDISAASNVALSVEQAANSAQSVLGTTGKVFAATQAACAGLGGLLGASMTVPAGTTVVQ
jgi:hypothetical protein